MKDLKLLFAVLVIVTAMMLLQFRINDLKHQVESMERVGFALAGCTIDGDLTIKGEGTLLHANYFNNRDLNVKEIVTQELDRKEAEIIDKENEGSN